MRLLLVTVVLLCSTSLLYPCGPGAAPLYGYQFLRADLFTQAVDFDRYFLTFDELAATYTETAPTQEKTNLEDWQDHLCDYVQLEDLRYVIYTASIEELELLRTSARSKNIPLPGRLQANTFADMLAANRCVASVDYLIFAKRAEPYVTTPADVWDAPAPDYATMLALVDEGRRLFRKTESSYLRLRYAYQLVRLAHYAKEYPLALQLYDELLPMYEPQESIMNYWLLGHRAGALMGLGRNVEAAHLYNLIFLHSPGKRESALRSIRIRDSEEWRQVLVRSENDTERASLYALRARQTEGNAAADLRAVYELDPRHPFLRILLLREIRKLERNLLGLDVNFERLNNERRYGVPKAWAERYIVDLQTLVREIAAERRVRQPELWELAEGYLELIAGDLTGAANTFAEVAPRLRNDTLQNQLEAFETALYLLELDSVNTRVEEELDDLRDESRVFRDYRDLPKLMRDKLYLLYRRAGRPGKAFLTHQRFTDLRRAPDEVIINDLLKVANEENPSGIERLLLDRAGGSGTIRNGLYDLKAMQLMREGQFEAALEVMKEIPRASWDDFGRFNPFIPKLKDCINCPRADTVNYNRGELLERLIALEYEARSDPLDAPLNYFRIGVALYNMTYFGPEWAVLANFRSGADWYCLTAGQERSACKARASVNFADVSQALYYFEKARLLADRPELAAGATFWAAKCELIQFYQSEAYRVPPPGFIPQIPAAYRRHYEILKTQYPETKVYDRVVAECAFFRAYL